MNIKYFAKPQDFHDFVDNFDELVVNGGITYPCNLIVETHSDVYPDGRCFDRLIVTTLNFKEEQLKKELEKINELQNQS